MSETYIAYFDGSCWPNPNGHAGVGAFVELNNKRVFECSKYIGNKDTTNNVAEYSALIEILRFLESLSEPVEITIYGDADMVIKQMNREWKAGRLTRKERNGKIPIRPRYYLPYYEEARRLADRSIHKITFRWIPREQNIDADFLSTKCLHDRGFKVFESQPVKGAPF